MLLTYAAALLLAVLVSERAGRTVLSTAVLFLSVGIGYGALRGPAPARAVAIAGEVALVTVLFTDGTRVPLAELRQGWRLPARALAIGFPLTLLGTALAARLLCGLGWVQALLAGAALAPTDPVFAAAIVGEERIPLRVRHLLNVESGLNDGLAVPFVVGFLAWAGHQPLDAAALGEELLAGIALGIAVPLAAVLLERAPPFGASEAYRPIGAVAVGLLVYALARLTGANTFLASFAAGASLATAVPRARAVLGPVGDVVGELLKLGALLVFGTLLSPAALGHLSAADLLFALLALAVVRPAAMAIALARTGIGLRELAVAGWFGPKGFASVVYGLLVASAGVPGGERIFGIIAITTALSIVLHSSTDVPVARRFERAGET